MMKASLLSDPHRKSANFLRMTFATLVPLTLLGCGQSEVQHSNLEGLEQSVIAFYDNMSLSDELRVREASGGVALEGFCVLSAYEDRVTPDSDKVIAANALLERHQLMGKEEYWHLIVKTTDGLRIVRFDNTRIPLISPRPAYGDKNCVTTKSIIFSKKSDPTGGAPLIGKFPYTTILINIQPGD